MPAVVIGGVRGQIELHEVEVLLPPDQHEQLSYSLDAADRGCESSPAGQSTETSNRWELANRRKGRFGFVGVFYMRDLAPLLSSLEEQEREELIYSLEPTNPDLLLSYFWDSAAATQTLENFFNTAFFSDLPITKTVEIHMNLIDGFKQFKLEGHKNDFLQDYRLALLDVMAQFCEMYRRSIPPDAPLTCLPVQASGQPTMA